MNGINKKNKKDMTEYAYKSGQYAYWICSGCKHSWRTKICNRVNGSGCPECASKQSGQRTINRQLVINGSLKESDHSCMEEWDYEKNTISPNEITLFSNKKVWWKCKDCNHSWKVSPNSRSKGTGCPVCNSSLANQKKILFHLERDGSFADNYPDFVKYWDCKNNEKSCYELTSNSTYLAHWDCPVCGHHWMRPVVQMAASKGCPHCIEMQKMSSIQRKTQEYILNVYGYDLKHEKECSILPKNPKTNYPLPYDNEVIISDRLRLIIEVNGEQHYCVTQYIKQDAQKRGVTPQEELEYLQWKDKYKKQYALSRGYYYLELPYYTFDNNSYKTLIDNKIKEILSTIQN